MKINSLLSTGLLVISFLMHAPLSYAIDSHEKNNQNLSTSDVKRHYINAFERFSDASDQLQAKAIDLMVLHVRVEKASLYFHTFKSGGKYPGFEDDLAFAENLYQAAKAHYRSEQKAFNKLADQQRSSQYKLQKAAKTLHISVAGTDKKR
ncbi:hypothetical protein Ctha_1298 [Chloroherpeton thalassium ATCC 35110]|uniref:Uncharacterized protein n=1 Tax=Chloroherpeton thalassium (strain ATCC 35110 / GB-78) TaxID=517418 RepID=B3QZ68_CHLT3|nr:hypothetical protein [Chloroherpeton thalassium]ACF13761.1 hypothetical protein Ctha_1298 [Chloroherpeton thalassium ATCC 35110]